MTQDFKPSPVTYFDKLSITEVAYATGFSNISKFSSGFMEFYGIPPSVYKGRAEEAVKNV